VRSLDPLSVTPRTREALAAALVRLLDDAPLRESYARKAVELIATGFTWEAVGERMINVYQAARSR
jgi:glycosyltransferase involved in cell wall biosynthesis